jgi:hypothetical protein
MAGYQASETTARLDDTDRRYHFLDQGLLYILSWDVKLSMNREEIGFVPGGARVNIFTEGGGPVYHVLNDRTAHGEDTVTGSIISGTDWAFLREDDVGEVNVRLSLRTDDNAVIDARVRGKFPLGPRGFRRFVMRDVEVGTMEAPFFGKVLASVEFETGVAKYGWLTRKQCVGVGRVRIEYTEAVSASFDVYAMH